jgi:hypothetical protein
MSLALILWLEARLASNARAVCPVLTASCKLSLIVQAGLSLTNVVERLIDIRYDYGYRNRETMCRASSQLCCNVRMRMGLPYVRIHASHMRRQDRLVWLSRHRGKRFADRIR